MFAKFAKKTSTLFVSLIIALTILTVPASAQTAGTCKDGVGWVNQTVSVTQGKQANGLPVALSRSNPADAWGGLDFKYFSLGRNGTVTYTFAGNVKNTTGTDLSIYETTEWRASSPLEQAKIEVSLDNITWFTVNPLATSTAAGTGVTGIDFASTGLVKIRFIRVTDIINSNDLTPTSDGFDLNAIRAAVMECAIIIVPPTPTITKTPTPTVTPTDIPTDTPTPSPTDTPTPTPTETPTDTPSPTITPTPTATKAPTPTPTAPTVPAGTTVTPSPTLSIFLITFRYDTQTAAGSPLVFGGAQHPDINHDTAWDLIRDVGFTSTRTDFFMENAIPKNITLDAYINNVNDVQNPATWNRDWIFLTNNFNQKSKVRGLKTIGILDYAPAWLTYSGTKYGVPKDWGVYKDIVKKMYREHRSRLDYIEIWNEPTLSNFFDLTNSNMTRDVAYTQMFITAAQGIHEVDAEINDGRRIPVIGPANDYPFEVSLLRGLLNNPTASANLDIASYHNYGHAEPSNVSFRGLLNSFGKTSTPLFVTEWNYSHNASVPNQYNTGALGISYTGSKLVDFLKQGMAGANYFLLNQVPSEGYMGIYTYTNGVATLLPQARSWQLLSKTLGLGNGPSTIYGSDTYTGLTSAGFKNSANQTGLAVVNTTAIDKQVVITATGLASSPATFDIYMANMTNDGKTLSQSIPYNSAGTQITVPANTVIGIIFR